MATFTKKILSGSTNGRAIQVSATSSPGTTIHTGPTGTSVLQEIWLYGMNADTTARKVTLEWGATGTTSDQIELTIPGETGLTLITPGLIVRGVDPALTIRAFAATTNVVNVFGYVNEIV